MNVSQNNIQTQIESLLRRGNGSSTNKASELGLPKLFDKYITKIEVVNNHFSVHLNWAGKLALYTIPDFSLRKNPFVVITTNVPDGKLLLKTDHIFFKNSPLKLLLFGNDYDLKV